ncbi:MAG: hypothetical protein ACE5JG_00840, partial [Planctomycetota bacterium]
MRWQRVLPLVIPILCAGGVAADGTGDPKAPEPAGRKVTVELKRALPDGETRLPYGESRAIALETAAPRFLFGIPEFAAKDPLFFRVDLGETGGVPFFGALDRSAPDGPHDRLYLDRDRDLDLTNDGEPLAARLREVRDLERTLVEFLDVDLKLPYRGQDDSFTETGRWVLFYYAPKKDQAPVVVQVERDSWREGRIQVGGVDYLVAAVDDDNNGIFTTSDVWAVVPEESGHKKLLSRDAMRSLVYPSWSREQDRTLEATSIDRAGRSLEVRIAEARETEREYFVRITGRTQSAEERSLKLDPLRPKAAPGQKIDWLRNETIARALEIGQKVKKRVLVDFFGQECPWCRRMDRYTYRDREVVS